MMTSKRSNEVIKMQEDLLRRKAALSLAKYASYELFSLIKMPILVNEFKVVQCDP